MDVFISPQGRSFHVSADCPVLAKLAHEVLTVDVLSLRRPKPCRRCLPDVPAHDRYHRPYCVVCGHARAHQHNGGILVREEQVVRVARGTLRAGDALMKTRWVWPDSPVLLAKHLAPVVE